MKQPSRKSVDNSKKVNKPNKQSKPLAKRNSKPKAHPKFGTSKLEQDFAINFLDKLGVEYEWQYEASEIGRFYDFKIKNGPILEINGSYWHGDSRIYEEKDLNSVQKKTMYIDELKKKWALTNGIPIYYIWEKDIRESPEKVMKFLNEILYIKEQKDNKRKRHTNKLNNLKKK